MFWDKLQVWYVVYIFTSLIVSTDLSEKTVSLNVNIRTNVFKLVISFLIAGYETIQHEICQI